MIAMHSHDVSQADRDIVENLGFPTSARTPVTGVRAQQNEESLPA